jgi:VWFA-related protein
MNKEARLQMKTLSKLAKRFQNLAWTVALVLGLLAVSSAQVRRVEAPNDQGLAGNTEKDYTVRIAVEEVRLDVVVLDKKGRQIPNLKAEDFEILQDGRPVPIRSCTYIIDQADVSQKPSVSQKSPKIEPPVPTRPLSRNAVRRVIAFVVDDLSMRFESMQYVRKALKDFVEKEMQPGDLVTIFRTTYGNSALQMFLSDKKQLLALIDTVRWGRNVGLDLDPRDLYMIFEGQLSTMRYCIGALQDMPGRKALILMTSMSTFPSDWNNGVQDFNAVDYNYLYSGTYNKVADEALRAGVVVHTMDMRGLEAPFPDAPTDTMLAEGGPLEASPFDLNGFDVRNRPAGGGGGGSLAGYNQMRSFGRGPLYNQMGGFSSPSSILQRNIEGRNPLSEKTGGLFLEHRNFAGLEEINDALQGYYLLSYAPPSATFTDSNQNFYHRITVRVKGISARVHTRDGFYGLTTSSMDTADSTDPMRKAIFSPFLYNDLNVDLASGYVQDAGAEYLVRSWLHLKLNELKLEKAEKDGQAGYNINLETVSVANDVTSSIHDASIIHYKFFLPEENLDYIRKYGMRFSLALPVKKPGPYYLRVAVKDELSGKIGSAYQFVDIPDLGKGDLALSNLFLVNRKEDIAWILSGAPEKNTQNWLVPNVKRDDGKSPALRNYQPGDIFKYMSIVYNAKHNKDQRPDLEYQFILYRDGQEVSKEEPQPLDLKSAQNLNEIPILGSLPLGKAMQEGDYVLQLQVRDRLAKNKKDLATQTLDFRIEKPDSSMQ